MSNSTSPDEDIPPEPLEADHSGDLADKDGNVADGNVSEPEGAAEADEVDGNRSETPPATGNGRGPRPRGRRRRGRGGDRGGAIELIVEFAPNESRHHP